MNEREKLEWYLFL